ncbi:MAG: RNA polymerase sigma factor [Isosphaeraceae bacterium]|nr:RNA polymerase sigma factor [Isosphaeraceae bacterium]
MTGAPTGSTQGDLGSLWTLGAVGNLSDAQLLDRFTARRDHAAEAAFAALVERHAAMVLRVCRATLGDDHDAQDAFQATFLVLVRRAGSIRRRDSVGSWLHGVARRVAARARVEAARRRAVERRRAERSERCEAGAIVERWPDLHEELDRLPEPYRAVIILCYFEGLTCEQAAGRLGWPIGTVKVRLMRARERLESRLTRRGIALSALAVPPESVPVAWVRAAAEFAAPAAGTVSASVVALTERVVKAMIWEKLKTAVLGSVLLSVLAGGALVWAAAHRAAAEPPKDAQRPKVAAPAPRESGPLNAEERRAVRDRLKAWWDGVQTLSVRFEEFAQDAQGGPDRTRNGHVEEFVLGLGDRRAYLFAMISPEGLVAPSMERREDGKRSAYLSYSRKTPGQLADVNVDHQSNTRTRYVGEMNDLTWMFLPIGDPTATAVSKPLYSYLDDGVMLERLRDPNGGERLVLTLFRADSPIRYELDPEHDWLPRRVDGMHDLVVTEFGKDGGGCWFPVEWTSLKRWGDQSVPSISRVIDLKINRPIPDSRFQVPNPLPDGARLFDLSDAPRR